jgi:hypothetical protein
MKLTRSLLFFLCATPAALAFAPSLSKVRGERGLMSMVADGVETELKLPYDAAARLAYNDWRDQFGKGDFNDGRFAVFKTNYEAITVANVVAKKIAREEGSDIPALMKLNEYGDYTEEEYMAAMSGTSTSTGDVLSKALDAAQSQSEASSALKDAAAALAKEEEALAKKLGLESVDELEVALDSMSGIAADGGELETGNIAREARVRSAYLGWCKDFGKKPDESRYPAFVDNFLTMEKFAQESGKAMNLNEYADCTEEQFKALAPKKSAPKPKKVVKKAPEPVADPAILKQQRLELEAKLRADAEEAKQQRLELEAKLRADAEEAEEKRQEAKAALLKERAQTRAKAAKMKRHEEKKLRMSKRIDKLRK